MSLTILYILRHTAMKTINRFSSKKKYDVIFFDKEDNCCGKAESVSLSNTYDVITVLKDICSTIPYYVIVTNVDGSESARWAISISVGHREF